MPTRVITVFDIGKTLKKVVLFDRDLNVVFREEKKFSLIRDDDGFECDDLEAIREWILTVIQDLVSGKDFDLAGINFSTYGASLVYLDNNGELLTPLYNYLKTMPADIPDSLYDKFGGKDEFCRVTASPALGMLNSGLQILWLKKTRPHIYSKVRHILHLPQYLSYILTGKIVSEFTSIGCHTAMWDFDRMEYHSWLQNERISLPDPVSNSTLSEVNISDSSIYSGTGIHDSSASLVPYLAGIEGEFLLLSTGTWCICMNPFNNEKLTAGQLENDSLCYMSINQKPVKSSRFFMGYIHDINVDRLSDHFSVNRDSFRDIGPSDDLVRSFLRESRETRVFFRNGIASDYIDRDADLSLFETFEEAYHRFIFDLTMECVNCIKLVLTDNDDVRKIFISGGFTHNEIFVRLLARLFPGKRIFTSEIDNSSALGAALVIWDTMGTGSAPVINHGLKEWKPY